MINSKPLTSIADFESLKKGDWVAVEFKRRVYEGRKEEYVFKVFQLPLDAKVEHKEIILEREWNIYFNYEMYMNSESQVKNICLLTAG